MPEPTDPLTPAHPDPALDDAAQFRAELDAAGQRARDRWMADHGLDQPGLSGPGPDAAQLAPQPLDHAPRGHSHPRTRTSLVARAAALADNDAGADSVADPLLDFAPVPHIAPRRNSITPDVQRRFIAALAATASVTAAARSVGKSLEAIYKLRARPGADGFCAAWDAALDRAMARLEAVAMERALEGEARPVLTAQGVVGEWRRHDNHLLMFLLRNRRSERFGENRGMLRPGNAVYERIRAQLRAEWEAEQAQKDEARADLARATLTAKLAVVRKRMGWDE